MACVCLKSHRLDGYDRPEGLNNAETNKQTPEAGLAEDASIEISFSQKRAIQGTAACQSSKTKITKPPNVFP